MGQQGQVCNTLRSHPGRCVARGGGGEGGDSAWLCFVEACLRVVIRVR